MDYRIDHALNGALRAHPLAGSLVSGFATYGVLAFGVAAVALWLLAAGRRESIWKRACGSALCAAAIALLVNQAIAHLWHRARPYQDHPHGIVPLLARTHDASFPSDHAAAAFAIAFGVWLVHRRAGRVFLAWAALIAASRVLCGVHYPSDVVAGAGIGAASAYLSARVLMRPLLEPLIALASRLTDPLVASAARAPQAATRMTRPHGP